MGTQEEAADLVKLIDLLADTQSRKRFVNDPVGTAAGAGVDTNVMSGVIDALADLSFGELRLVANLNSKMVSLGFTDSENHKLGRQV